MSFLSFRQQPETVVSTAFPSLEAWSHFPQLGAGDGHGQLVAQQFPHRLHRDPGVTVERHPAAPLAGMGKSIPSCQGEINRVFQPPPELRQGGIPSRGRKQGCFQPPAIGRSETHLISDFLEAPSDVQFNPHRSQHCISPVRFVIGWWDR